MSATDRTYSGLGRDELAARLRVAEDALIFIGWTSTTLGEFEGTQRGDAAMQAWSMWCKFIGGTDELDPDKHPYLIAIEPQLARCTRPEARRVPRLDRTRSRQREGRDVTERCSRCDVDVEVVATDGGRNVALDLNPLGNIVLARVDDTDTARWLKTDEQPKDPLQPRYRAHILHCTGRPT